MDHLDAGRLHRGKEGRKISGPLRQNRVDDRPELFFLREPTIPAQPLTVVKILALTVELGILDDRQIMLQAHPVRQTAQGKTGAQEVAVLAGIVQGNGVVVDVIMDVLAVCMGGNEKGILAFGPAHRRFIAHLVCLPRGNLSRLEGLADLIAQHIGLPALLPARGSLVLSLGKQELGVGGHVVALVGGNQFAALRLIRVLPIVQAVFEGVGNGFSLADMVGNQACGGRSSTSSLFRKPAASQPPVRYGTKCPKGQPVIKLCKEYFSE